MHVHYPVSTLLLLLVCFVLSEKSFFFLAPCPVPTLPLSLLSIPPCLVGRCGLQQNDSEMHHFSLAASFLIYSGVSLSPLPLPPPRFSWIFFFFCLSLYFVSSSRCCLVWPFATEPAHTHTLSGVLAAPQSSVCLPGNTTADDGAVG